MLIALPLIEQKVHAGFPSPADDYIEDTIALDDVLIASSVATFLWGAAVDCMVDTHIFHSDVIVVDRGQAPKYRLIVLAVVARRGELFEMVDRSLRSCPE